MSRIIAHILRHYDFIPYTFAIGIFLALMVTAIPKQEKKEAE